MHISAELKAIAFLPAILVPALGAVTEGQVVTQLQDMNNAIQNIINDATDLPAATLVDEVDSITKNLGDFNLEIPGSPILSIEEQNGVVDQIDINALLLTATFELTLESVDVTFDVEDKTDVEDSAVDLYDTFDDTVVALGQLGTTIEGIIPSVKAKVTEAIKAIESS